MRGLLFAVGLLISWCCLAEGSTNLHHRSLCAHDATHNEEREQLLPPNNQAAGEDDEDTDDDTQSVASAESHGEDRAGGVLEPLWFVQDALFQQPMGYVWSAARYGCTFLALNLLYHTDASDAWGIGNQVMGLYLLSELFHVMERIVAWRQERQLNQQLQRIITDWDDIQQ